MFLNFSPQTDSVFPIHNCQYIMSIGILPNFTALERSDPSKLPKIRGNTEDPEKSKLSSTKAYNDCFLA